MNRMLYRPFLLGLLLATSHAANLFGAIAFAPVSPGSVTLTTGNPGLHQLNITGLTNGETVRVEKFLDLNGNGIAEPNIDLLVQSFTVTDGQIPTIGGIRDINQPGDSDAGQGAIEIRLGLYSASELNRVVGQYIFRITPASSPSTPLFQNFLVQQSAVAGTITGNVVGGGPAVVFALDATTDEAEFVAAAVSSPAGAYTLNVPFGSYKMLAVKKGFVDNFGTAPVTSPTAVTPNVVRNLTPLAGTKTITGRVVDQENGTSLPGVQIFANSTNGFVTIGTTDASGAYTLSAALGVWRIEASEKSLPLLGYLTPPDDDQGMLDLRVLAASSKFITVPRGEAMVFGTVLDKLGAPVPFVAMQGQNQQGPQWRSHGFTDANGSYSLLATANNDAWGFGGEAFDFAALNLIAPGTNSFFLTAPTAYPVNFTALPPTAAVSGRLVDNANNPIAGAEIGANLGNQEYRALATTAADGSFALGLVGGFWSVFVENQDSLAARGLIAPDGSFVFVTDGVNQTNVILIAPRAPLQISGRVSNASGSPLPYVEVLANNSSFDFQTNYQTRAVTDANGNYRLAVFNSPNAWSLSLDGGDLSQQGYFGEFTANVAMQGSSKVANFVLPPPLFYPFFPSYGVAKGRSFQQIPNGSPTSRPELPFVFNAFADGVPAGSALLRPPSGPTRFLSGGYNSSGVEEPFASLTDLNATFPNGAFNFAFNTYSNGVRSASVTLAGDLYPNAPRILDLDQLQQLAANSPVVLEWDPFVGATTNDFIEVYIEDDQGNEVYSTPGVGQPGALSGTATSTFVFVGFPPGRQYRASILFAKIVASNKVSLPGAFGFAAYFSETRFPVGVNYQPDAEFLSVFKGELYTQAVQSSPLLAGTSPYAFRAQVGEPGLNNSPRVTSAQVETPNPIPQTILLNNNPGTEPEWSIAETYPNGAALDTARPDGLYRLTINGLIDGTKTVTLNLAGNAYPDVPRISNLDFLQQINPGDGFFVDWTLLASGSTNDFLVLQIFDGDGDEVFSTPPRSALDALQGTDSTTYIPPFILLPGRSYTLTLRFERTTVLNTTDYPGAVGIGGYYRETATTIRTVTSPNLFPVVNSERNERAGGFAFDGENYLLGINADGLSNAVQLISLSGETVGRPVLAGFGSEPPLVAFDGTNYLVAWIESTSFNGGSTDSVKIQFVSRSGQLLGSARSIAGPGNNRFLNSVVFGTNQFLLVWQERQPLSGNDILGQFVAAGDINGDALPVTTPFVISGSNLDEVDAVAGFAGGNFLVAYQRPLNNAANSFHVFSRLISPAGVLANAVQVSQTPSARHSPMAVGLGSNSFFVIWSRDVGPGAPTNPSWDLFGRLVNASGQPSGGEFAVSTAAGNQILPSVTFDGSTFLAGWIDTDPNDTVGFNNRARGRFFAANGTPINQPFALLKDIFGRPPATIGLSFTGRDFLAVATYAYSTYFQGQSFGLFGGDVFGSFISPVAPQIFLQPQDDDVVIGEPALFLVGASGDEPLTYQWRTNGIPILNETNFFLSLPYTTPLNSGIYSVVVANQFGSVTSSNAVLRVLSPPVILQNPLSLTASLLGSAVFSVSAAGDGTLHYQWSRNGRIIPAATNSSLVLTNLRARDLGAYVVTVENQVGAIASQVAFLRLAGIDLGLSDTFAGRMNTLAPQGIGTGTTTNTTKEVGEPRHAGRRGGRSVWYSWTAPASGVAVFSTEGSAFDTVIAIYTGTAINNLVPVASDDDSGGFGTSIVRFNATLGQTYLIAIDGYGGASGDVVLSWELRIGEPPVAEIVQQPVSQSLPIGTNATFVVVAQSPGPIFYQWYFNDDAIFGQTGPSLTITNIQSDNAGS
ncbi:MAG: hypothetical protein H7X97_10805, partial [Opitutaceae bacterium]|nr:hypothetical protein [Verrucomicrobiales bacterium]